MKQISVIGATSPLGVHLVPKLVGESYSVKASFRTPERVPDDWRQISSVSLVDLDLTKEKDSPAFNSDVVIWLAHLDAGRDNAYEAEANLGALESFLRNADLSLTKKIVFVSSGGSVYGSQDSVPISEDQERRPISSYGKAKRALEDRLLEFSAAARIKIAILRPGNIYGFESPFRFSKGVVGAFLRALDSKSRFTLIHGGNTVRDFVYVDDVCDAIVLAVKHYQEKIIWNVSTGVGHTVNDVLNMILRNTGDSMPDLEYIKNYDSDVLVSLPSPERINRETGWCAKTDLDRGISKTVDNWHAALQRRIQVV